MLTSSRFAYVYPQNTDTPDLGRDFLAVATAIEKAALYIQGTISSRPAASIQGRFFASTDETPRQLYFDYGTGWFQVGALAASAVGNAQLADGSVSTTKLADGAVTSVKIADGSIVAGDIADNSLTAAKLVDAIVPSRGAGATVESLRALGSGAGQAVAGNDARLSDARTPTDNSVTTVKLVDGSVNSAKVLDASLAGGDMVADTITAREIAAGAVGTSEVADASLFGTDMVAGSVTGRELANGSVSNAKLDAATQTQLLNKIGTQISNNTQIQAGSQVVTTDGIGYAEIVIPTMTQTLSSIMMNGDINAGDFYCVATGQGYTNRVAFYCINSDGSRHANGNVRINWIAFGIA